MKVYITMFVSLLWAASVFGNTPREVEYMKQDSVLVMQMLNRWESGGGGTYNASRTFLFFARQFMGYPYVAHTLDKNVEERLVVNMREVDCTTFVEYALALTQCVRNGKRSFADFCDYLQAIRYIGGDVSYLKRKHYFTLWITENEKQGFVRDIQAPQPPFSAVQTINVDYMTTHVPAYYMLNQHPSWVEPIRRLEESINGQQWRYIPKLQIVNTKLLRETIKDGDILVIITGKKGLDTSHIGIAKWHQDGLHMIHASQVYKKVVEDPVPLRQYLQRYKTHLGIRAVRVQ